MDEQLKLAEAYYAVAQHLQREGERLLDIAHLLGITADKMCEERMRQNPAPPASASTVTNSTGE